MRGTGTAGSPRSASSSGSGSAVRSMPRRGTPAPALQLSTALATIFAIWMSWMATPVRSAMVI